MKRSIGLVLVVGGLAGAATAQDIYFTWSNDAIDPVGMGDIVTITCEMFFTPDPNHFYYFANSLFDVIGDDIPGTTLSYTDGRYFYFSGTSPGTVSGDDILGIDEFQLPAGFGGGDFSNPISTFFVFEYTVTDDTMRAVTYTSEHFNADIYIDGLGTSVAYNVHVTPTTFWINVPSPSGMALLGLGGLVAVRRRR